MILLEIQNRHNLKPPGKLEKINQKERDKILCGIPFQARNAVAFPAAVCALNYSFLVTPLALVTHKRISTPRLLPLLLGRLSNAAIDN